MSRKPDAAAELSAKMTQALEAQRAQPGGYPLTVRQLSRVADPQAPPELVLKALAKASRSRQVVPASMKNLDAPIALHGDLELLASSPQVLEFALESLHADGTPAWPLKKVSARLDKSIRTAFEAAVTRQHSEHALPESVGVVNVRGKQSFFLKRQPPPQPPPPPDVELAGRLVRVLEAQQRLGLGSYPVRQSRLVELTGPPPPPKVLKKALAAKPFAGRAVPLLKEKADPLWVFADDPRLLRLLLETCRTETVQAFPVSGLKTKLSKQAEGPFADALGRLLTDGGVPGIAWIGARVGKKEERLLFLMEDVRGPRAAAAPSRFAPETPAAPPPADFAAAFDEAFARLDRQAGSPNYVSLADLRKALPVDRAAFDAQLRRLRESGRYTLGAAEVQDGLGEEQRAAGVVEDGSLLLFVSRRSP
jgi:hypothetical protein